MIVSPYKLSICKIFYVPCSCNSQIWGNVMTLIYLWISVLTADGQHSGFLERMGFRVMIIKMEITGFKPHDSKHHHNSTTTCPFWKVQMWQRHLSALSDVFMQKLWKHPCRLWQRLRFPLWTQETGNLTRKNPGCWHCKSGNWSRVVGGRSHPREYPREAYVPGRLLPSLLASCGSPSWKGNCWRKLFRIFFQF